MSDRYQQLCKNVYKDSVQNKSQSLHKWAYEEFREEIISQGFLSKKHKEKALSWVDNGSLVLV